MLAALTGLGLIERLQDPLNRDRSVCVIVKPIVRLHQLVIAPNEAELAAGNADQVLGAQPGNRGGADLLAALRVGGQAVVPAARGRGHARRRRPRRPADRVCCRDHQLEHELDAVVVEDPVADGRVLAIGETNAADGPMDARQLRRLEHLRSLLPGDRVRQPTRLLLFSRSGFTAGLVEEAAARPDVKLVDLARIYQGT